MIMWETYWRKIRWSSNITGWIDETSENLEHVPSEVEPVVCVYSYMYINTIFFSPRYSYLRSSNQAKITDVLYSIGKENHYFSVTSVVFAVPNE